jgi:hypothetical protein
MPNITLECFISDSVLPLIDKIHGPIPREDFLRKALELGVGNFIETAVRTSRDYVNQKIFQQTVEFETGRAAMRIDEPQQVASASPIAELVQRRSGQPPG